MLKVYTKLQVENILLIDKLRMEADRENPGFLCSIGPWDGIGILNRFFEMVKSRKEKQFESGGLMIWMFLQQKKGKALKLSVDEFEKTDMP